MNEQTVLGEGWAHEADRPPLYQRSGGVAGTNQGLPTHYFYTLIARATKYLHRVFSLI